MMIYYHFRRLGLLTFLLLPIFSNSKAQAQDAPTLDAQPYLVQSEDTKHGVLFKWHANFHVITDKAICQVRFGDGKGVPTTLDNPPKVDLKPIANDTQTDLTVFLSFPDRLVFGPNVTLLSVTLVIPTDATSPALPKQIEVKQEANVVGICKALQADLDVHNLRIIVDDLANVPKPDLNGTAIPYINKIVVKASTRFAPAQVQAVAVLDSTSYDGTQDPTDPMLHSKSVWLLPNEGNINLDILGCQPGKLYKVYLRETAAPKARNRAFKEVQSDSGRELKTNADPAQKPFISMNGLPYAFQNKAIRIPVKMQAAYKIKPIVKIYQEGTLIPFVSHDLPTLMDVPANLKGDDNAEYTGNIDVPVTLPDTGRFNIALTAYSQDGENGISTSTTGQDFNAMPKRFVKSYDITFNKDGLVITPKSQDAATSLYAAGVFGTDPSSPFSYSKKETSATFAYKQLLAYGQSLTNGIPFTIGVQTGDSSERTDQQAFMLKLDLNDISTLSDKGKAARIASFGNATDQLLQAMADKRPPTVNPSKTNLNLADILQTGIPILLRLFLPTK